MPLWLFKFLPVKVFLGKLLPYWKPILAAIVFMVYSFTLNSCAVDRTNVAWEIKESARVEQELINENKALSEAANLKASQDSAAAARESALKLQTEAAEQRAEEAQASADNQRRLNNATTKDFKELQATSGAEPVDLATGGVRDTLHSLQDEVRSRR